MPPPVISVHCDIDMQHNKLGLHTARKHNYVEAEVGMCGAVEVEPRLHINTSHLPNAGNILAVTLSLLSVTLAGSHRSISLEFQELVRLQTSR